jgi:WD40 repeat protein
MGVRLWEPKEVRLWEVGSGRTLATIPGADSHSVAWSPDGRAIATGDISGHVKVWDVADLPGAGPGRSTP